MLTRSTKQDLESQFQDYSARLQQIMDSEMWRHSMNLRNSVINLVCDSLMELRGFILSEQKSFNLYYAVSVHIVNIDSLKQISQQD